MDKEKFYFSHDYDPLSDPKLSALVGEFKADGYGLYWRIVEMLHSDPNHRLACKPYIYAGIAKQMGVDAGFAKALIAYAIETCELFETDGETFWSERVFRNFEKRAEIREKRKKAGEASAEARRKKLEAENQTTEAEQDSTHVEHVTAPDEQVEANSNKGKESKGKENKVKEYKKILLSEVKPSDFPELNPEHVEIANAFQALFRANLQDAGAATSTVDRAKGTAIDDVRLMLDADHYTTDDLRAVYRFLQEDNFWKQNILSTSKLREQMPKIKLKIHNQNGPNRTTRKEGTSWNELAAIIAGSGINA